MKKFWKKSAASLMAFSLLMGNNYAIHALDGESPDTGETPPAPESDPGYTIHGTLMSGETAIGDPVTINAADYTEQKPSGEAAPAVEEYSFDNAYITREGNSDVVVSFGSASYVTDAGTEVSYADVSNDEHVVETVFSYTKNEETPAPAGEEPTPEPAAEETEKPADTEQEEDPAKSEIIKVKLEAKKNAPLLRSSNALEVSVGLYDYDDAGTLAFPSDFGGSEKVYAVVWVGDSSDISAAATDTPWAVVDITDIKEKNSPYTFDVGSFDTSPWGGAK